MNDYHALKPYFQTRQDAMVASIRALVERETPSTEPDCLNRCAGLLVDRFRQAGAHAERIAAASGGDHVRARFPAGAAAAPSVLVLTHFDTVWPVGRIETHPFRLDEAGRAFGPGIFDMKSSLVVMEYLFRALRDLALTPPRTITLLATADEEIGSRTSQALIEEEARRADYVLVLEPPLPGGVLKTERKGSLHIELEIAGRAAHAGIEIEKGVSAIEEAAHQILAVQALTDLTSGVTANAGLVRGGTRANVVAARAVLQIDVRAWTQRDLDAALQALRALRPVLPEARLRVKASAGRPPLEAAATTGIFQAARALAARLGMELRAGRTGGGSDGNLTGALGKPTLDGLGVPGAGAHADHEHIELDQLAARSWLIAALVMELSPSSFADAKALS